MKRTALALFVVTWAMALVSAYALTSVYWPVEAASVAFMVGMLYGLGAVPLWRTLSRWVR
jgi:nitrate/nitrite transporter NarK